MSMMTGRSASSASRIIISAVAASLCKARHGPEGDGYRRTFGKIHFQMSAEMAEHDTLDFSRQQFLDDARRGRVREVPMTRLDSLFHRPRPTRIILQKFFVMIGFDHERLDLAQAFHNHFCRVAEIGDETETARARVTGKPKGIDSVVWHGECLHGHVADGELGARAKDSPVAILLE